MKARCVLELMKEKGHIKTYETGTKDMPRITAVTSLRGESFASKLYEVIDKDDSFISEKKSTKTFLVCEKKELYVWLKSFKGVERTIDWTPCPLDYKIYDYCYKNGEEIKLKRFDRANIINLAKKEKLRREESKKRIEAIELLEKICGD